MAVTSHRNICLILVAATYIQVALAIPLKPPSVGSGLSGLLTGSGQVCLSDDLAERARRQQVTPTLYPFQKAFNVQSFNNSTPDVNDDALLKKSCPTDGWGSTQSCPTGKAPDHNGNPDVDSTCPFSYVTCYDPERIPARITIAQCECSACLGPYDNKADPNLQCKPIMHNIKVLRRKSCKDGMFRYEEEDERIPVACACMRRAVNLF